MAHRKSPRTVSARLPHSVGAHRNDCTHSVSSGEVPTNGTVSAGGLFFPQSAAPHWRPKPEHRVPNSVDVVSLVEEVGDMGVMTRHTNTFSDQ